MSNRLTFSLASLIVLIAFGLVFGPTSVMAHEGNVGNQVHKHPLPDTLAAKDLNDDDDTADPGEAEVQPHNDHPTPTVSLVAKQDNVDSNIIKVTTTAATFKVQVDFGMVVSGQSSDETADTDLTLTPTLAVVNAAKNRIITNGSQISTAFARSGTKNTTLEATVTINAAGLPTGETDPDETADYAIRETYFRISIPADSVYSLQLDGLIAKDGTTVVDDVSGSGNYATPTYVEFKLVKEFDKTGPTATVMADPKFNADGDAVFTIAFNEALVTSGAGALTLDDFTIVNGSTTVSPNLGAVVSEDDGSVDYSDYFLSVTPENPYEGVKVTLKKDSVTDSLKNKGPVADVSDMVTEDIKPAVTVSVAQVINATNTKAKFHITFTEALSSSHFNKLDLINDLTIDGGTVEAADLTGPSAIATPDDLQDDQGYVLTVTPLAFLEDGDEVSVTVNPQIQDTANNNIDLTRGTPSASFNIDLLAPTVKITAPAAPLTGEETGNDKDDAGKLEFTFLFSEPINPTTFTASDIVGEDYVVTDAPTKDATYTPPAGTMKEKWTARVKPTDDDSVTVVLNVDAVADLVGRTLAAGEFATYSPAVPKGEDPAFSTKIKGLPAGICEGDKLPRVELPLAIDTEGEKLTYELRKATLDADGKVVKDGLGAIVPNSPPAPTAGFYWEAVDAQTRLLKAKSALTTDGYDPDAKSHDAKKVNGYAWTVTDSVGNTATVTFSIIVKPYAKPGKPTGLKAKKLDAPSMQAPTMNRVTLMWDDPGDKSSYANGCIPAIASYTVTRSKLNEYTNEFEVQKDATVTTDGPVTSYTTPDSIPYGIYQFTITATNKAGDSPASDAAEWEKTGGKRVVVADPPRWSPLPKGADLRAAVDPDGNHVTVNWVKVPDDRDGEAPVYDDLVDMAHPDYASQLAKRNKFYGPEVATNADKDFAGYAVYMINETTQNITRYPEDTSKTLDIDDYATTVSPYDHPTYRVGPLAPGQYVFRVTASNVAGESERSISTIYATVTIVGAPPGTPNKAPDFGDATIASITATKDQAISGRFLPEAKDADGNTLTYSVVEDLPTGLMFNATTRALTGTPTAVKAETAYTYKVTDPAGASDTIGFFITVNAATQPPTGPTPATTIASKGYAVFVPANHDASALPNGLVPHTVANMPDLSGHFIAGGTIDVIVTGKANHNVIITEIMVAKDLGRVGQSGMMRPEAGQWIELYNNTAAAINVSDITLMFTTGYPAPAAPANATDRISNTVAPGWGFDATFVEAASGQTAVNASGVVTVPKMFKSLRRKYKDDKKLQDAGTVIENGWNTSSWTLTADTKVFLAGRVGTPGSENRPSTFSPAVFKAPQMEMTFNEIANRSDNSNEWIELKGAAGATLRKHKISVVTAYDKATNKGTETTIYQFPDNDDVKIPSNGILLITDQNPASNELAADLENGVPKEGIRYRIRTLAPLPNDGNFLLVLRDKDGNIEDVAGHDTDLSDDNPYTTLWPLAGNVGRISAKNKLEADKVYRRARGDIHGYSSKKDNGDEPAFEKMGFTGIGYDRNASVSDMNGGTPGYPNNAYINAGNDAKKVIISEIMYSQDKAGRLAQWIELQNLSATTGVDLHNWRLYIVNHDNADFTGKKVLDEVWLRNMKIPPLQTALIVSHTGRNTTNLPSHRVLNLRRKISEPLLSKTGFELRLEAKSNEGDVNKREKGDVVGNLVAFDSEMRRADHQAFADPVWALPSGMDENGDRVSIARRTSAKIVMLDGTSEWHWLPSNEDGRSNRMNSLTYYGDANDIGSPGQTVGGVLPVSLSKFRPERQDDGNIVIRWVTESETNNAGFNILRGEALDGEFTKLNTKLIAGQGTTSERTTYTYSDTSAKPNVVYYYQIQDVSLDGQVQTLRTTHLRGNVSAAGKLTTTWGKLKALQ